MKGSQNIQRLGHTRFTSCSSDLVLIVNFFSFFLQKTTTVQRITCVLIGLIKLEFEYALCAFQDELVDRLLFIKDKIFLKH